jgi:diguanylate cyclase
MKIRIRNWWQVLGYSALVTLVSVAVPLIVVSITLWPLPFKFKLPILAISGFIPLFIAAPISIFALNILRLIQETVEKLDNIIKFDSLTGVLVRGHFLHLIAEIRNSAGYVAIVDADHFKRINDTYGHEAGDIALKHIATTMRQAIGTSGIVGRMGGEEFAIYLPGASYEQAKLVCSSICSALRNIPIVYRGAEIFAKVSLGVVQDSLSENITATMRRADMCLYQAKAGGRDRFIFEQALDDKAHVAA